MSPCFPPTGDVLRLGRISGNALNGGWSSWTSWTQCSRDCSRGIRSRKRACSNPEPKYGGQTCLGPAQEYQECNVTPCPGEGRAGLAVECVRSQHGSCTCFSLCNGCRTGTFHTVSRHKTNQLQISGVTKTLFAPGIGDNPRDAEVCNHTPGN